MKTKELDISQPVEAHINLGYQAEPFVISGHYEAVAPIVEGIKNAPAIRTVPIAKAAVEAVRSSDEVLTGRRATIAAKMHDLRFGSSMYDLLLQKRAEERDLAIAKRLGIITATHCQKHEKQLAMVRTLQ